MFFQTERNPYVVTWIDRRGVERSARCVSADEAAHLAEQACAKGARSTTTITAPTTEHA